MKEEFYNPYEEKIKEGIAYDVFQGLQNIQTSIETKDEFTLSSDSLYDELTNQDEDLEETLSTKTFNLQDKREDYNYVGIQNNSFRIYDVKNKRAFEEYKKKAEQLIDEVDERIDEVTSKNENGLYTGKLLKSIGTDRVRRAIAGYPDSYMALKYPFIYGINAIGACLEARVNGDEYSGKTLSQKIEKWRDDFPIHDAYTDGAEMIDNLIEYDIAKKKGTLSPEREEVFRNMLYSNILQLKDDFEKIESVITDPEKNKAVYEDRVVSVGNDPFHLHSKSARGCLSATVSLEMYQAGLENGWAIEDLAVLAAFNYNYRKNKYDLECNGSMSLDGYKEYETPKYKNDDHKKYFQDMGDLVEKIKTTRLKDVKDRNALLNEMKELIDKGIEKNYLIQNQPKEAFNAYFHDARLRDRNIKKGKEKAVYNTDVRKNATEVDKTNIISATFNTKRSIVFFGKESDEHEAVRKSIDEYKKILKNKPDIENYKDPNDPGKVDYYSDDFENKIQQFEKLEEIQFKSRIYINAKMKDGVSSEAGKERLRGAKASEKYAKNTKLKIMEEFKKDFQNISVGTIEEFRKDISKYKADRAFDKISSMKAFPKGKKAVNELWDAAADMMVHKFAESKVEANVNAFNIKGRNTLKQEILANSDFKSLMKQYMKDKTMNPEKLASELRSDMALVKMSKISKELKAQDAARKKAASTKLAEQVKRNQRPDVAKGMAK